MNFQSLVSIMICIKKCEWQATIGHMVTFKQIWMKKAKFSHGCKQLGADQSWMNLVVIPRETVCNPNAWGLNEQWEVRRSENEALDLPSSTAVAEPKLLQLWWSSMTLTIKMLKVWMDSSENEARDLPSSAVVRDLDVCGSSHPGCRVYWAPYQRI